MEKNKLFVYGLLICILFFSFLLRSYQIDKRGVWFDEKISISNATSVNVNTLNQYKSSDGLIVFTTKEAWANNKPKHVIQSAMERSGGNAIAYNIVLHYWIKLFGTKDSDVRFLSLLFGVGTIIIGGLLSYKISNKNLSITLLSILLLAFNFYLIRYSQFARGYSMGTFLCITSTLLLYEIWRKQGSDEITKIKLIIIYALLAVSALFTHFLTFGFLLAHLVFIVLFIKDKNILNYFFIISAIAVALFVIFLISDGYDALKLIFYRSGKYTKIAQSPELASGFALPLSYRNALAGITQVILHVFGNGFQNFGIQIRWLIPLLFFPIIICFFSFKYFQKSSYNVPHFLLLLPVFGQLLIAFILALISKHIISFQITYFVFSVPGALIYMSFGLIYAINKIKKGGSFQKRFYLLIITGFSLIFIVSLIPQYTMDLSSRDNRGTNPYLEIAHKIENLTKEGDTIIYGNANDAVVTNFYLPKTFQNTQIVDNNPEIFNQIILKNNYLNLGLFNFDTINRY